MNNHNKNTLINTSITTGQVPLSGTREASVETAGVGVQTGILTL